MARILECTAEQYHADALSPVPTLSRSIGLILLDRSPKHAYAAHPRLGGAARAETEADDVDSDDIDEDEDDKKKDDEKAPRGRGSIFHTLTLAPHEDKREEIWFEEEVKVDGQKQMQRVPAVNFKKKAAMAAKKDALARGKIPVRAGGMEYANNGAQRFLEAFKRLGIVPSEHRCETSIEFEDEGVLCRARLDLIVELPKEQRLIIYDPKFMKRGTAKMLTRSALSFGYDVEAAAHIKAAEAVFPQYAGRVEFVPLACELGSWLVTPHYLGGMMLALGEKRWEIAREIWRKCLAENKWPAYESTVLEAPPWALQEWGVEL